MTTLPLAALVSLDAAVQALLLLAVEPRLRGVALAAPVGSGKTSLARGLQALLGPVPFVELPLNADDDGLLGGLDLEATLRLGQRVVRPGLLARAHGGVVYCDQINILADGAANHVLTALDTGSVVIEREGISLRTNARFCLVASYDPAEGPPRHHLLDRLGLLVLLPSQHPADERAAVVRRNLGATEDVEDAQALLEATALAGRDLLPLVQISDEQIEELVGAALAFGVQGHRAEQFAVLAACAAAALAQRTAVERDDLELAVRLAILPRATRIPQPADQPPAPPQQQTTNGPTTSDSLPPTDAETPPPPEDQDERDGEGQQQTPQPLEEQVLAALSSDLPTELLQLPFRAQRRGRAGSRGSTGGNRGRHLRSTPGDPRRRRLDLAATLRAAAPWQRLRSADGHTLALRSDDLRVKQFRTRAGALFCFVVDASGSMALNRMRQAKGAVHALLQQAYIHRDRVALIAFRGQRADLLLPPSQSVELARRALDTLPTGGGTPLASALLLGIDVAAQARSRGIMQTVLVLLTDGRGNIGLHASDRPAIAAELQALSGHIAASSISAVVVDTQRAFLSQGEARKLAGWLGGSYVYLPNAHGEQIANVAQGAVER